MDVAVLVPMLGRPHRVEPLLESLTDTTDQAHVLFLTSPEDIEVHEAIAKTGCERLDVEWQPTGDYARKINTGVRATNEPLLFLGADDLRFHPNWLERAVEKIADGVGVVGTNDLCNRRVTSGQHATHFLVTRAYVEWHGTIDEPGKALHEGYVHEYVDDEMVGTAKARGAWAFAADSIVEHLHPMAGKAPMDELYAQQAQRMRAGQRLYQRRRRLWT